MMTNFSAVFVTDAWDVHKDEVIVEFSALSDSSEDSLVREAKLQLAKDFFGWPDEEMPHLEGEENINKKVAWEAQEGRRLIKELETDGFYIKLVTIFKGQTLINKAGVKVS